MRCFLTLITNWSLNNFFTLSESCYISAQFYLHGIINYADFILLCIWIASQKTRNLKEKKTGELNKFIIILFYLLPAMNCLFFRGDRGCRWYMSLDLYRSMVPMLNSTVFCIKSTTANPLQFPNATLREKKKYNYNVSHQPLLFCLWIKKINMIIGK